MKKITYTLIACALFTFGSQNNGALAENQSNMVVLSPQISTTDIFNYLNTNLGLSATQKPTVKSAVEEAGAEVTKLNTSTLPATEIAAAKTNIVNALVKKLSGGILSSTQATKLSGLTSKLTSMFSQLK